MRKQVNNEPVDPALKARYPNQYWAISTQRKSYCASLEPKTLPSGWPNFLHSWDRNPLQGEATIAQLLPTGSPQPRNRLRTHRHAGIRVVLARRDVCRQRWREAQGQTFLFPGTLEVLRLNMRRAL